MSISEQIKQRPIKSVKNEPTKMSKKELEEYAKIVEERAKALEEQIKQQLENDTDNSRNDPT